MFLKWIIDLWREVGIRYRLAGAYTLVFGTTLVVFSALLFRAFIETHQRQFDSALYNHAVDVSEAVNVDLFGDLSLRTDVVSEGDKLFPFALGQSFLEIRSHTGEIIGRGPSLGEMQLPYSQETIATKLGVRSALFQTVDLRGFPGVGDRDYLYRMITYVVHRPHGDNLYLQIAVPRIFLEHERRGLLTVFLTTVPAILIIGLLTGLLLSHRALRPVHQITEIAQAISAQNLSERVPVPRAKDELRELAQTFNELLDRLKRAFDGQERFIADASHQLKTPLSILRGELDVLVSRARSPQELTAFLTSASQEINQLIRMTEDLLILARADAGEESLHRVPVQLEDVIVESTARLERLAHQKQVKLQVEFPDTNELNSGFTIQGDPELLGCMVANLVENAIKYSPEHSTVAISASSQSELLYRIEVKDQGSGIEAARLPHIFERFYRGQRSKSRVPGTGLGLAIAQQIARIHQAHITVQSELGRGSTFVIEIKKI